ncbi:ATP-binding protein [Microbacterium sp. BK668]|uniref:ATP-binding protein n=1 Tax=Microbacterium sp. BK668 TaxID=2512118 RepID=UPI0010600562|nr:ATP-binding protein [Microbacterium sp. BK668]TDN90904.1 ATPase family protein associated with various cellular activities (AAA) [Microbacterium sp. BK668]
MTGWLDALRDLAAVRVAAQRARWNDNGGTVHAAIDDILARRAVEAAPEALPEAAPEAVPEVSAARAAIDADPRWQRLVGALGLDDLDVEWLALVCACELDPRLTRVLGYLDDTAAAVPATPAAAALLWGWPLGVQPGPASAVVRWELAQPHGDMQSTTPWAMDAEIAAFLAGAEWLAVRREADPAGSAGHDCLHPALLTEMTDAVSPLHAGVVELVGRPGSGRRTLLEQLAAALGREAVRVAPGSAIRGLRAARLRGAIAIVAARPGDPVALDDERLTFVACEAAPASDGALVRLRWDLPVPTASQRRALWGAASVLDPPAAVADWELTPAEIRTAARAGRAASLVLAGRVRDGSLATMQRLPRPYSWDDLIVADHVERALERLLVEVRLRSEVLDEWEFRRLAPSSSGVTALFAGPSGTGKTMATQVLARELGLELFRVDLATVVSKYIGETEKQLAAVFDEAERSRIMVLFDEADALFGQRTTVRDAHDRYANIEIDYLLQRLDSFRGVAVLATNRKGDLDPAFLRRLRTVVDFVAPAPAERLRLWRSALPRATSGGIPVTEDLDHEWLAAHLDLTGAEITTIALGAAFDARQAGRLITLDTVVEASRRELGKRGAVLRIAAPARTEVAP